MHAVRRAIEAYGQAPSIDAQRYQKLCEVGTHPVPGNAPGHFTGTGRPVLGGFFQEAGSPCMTELGLTVASCAIPLAILCGFEQERKQAIFDVSYKLVQNLGGFRSCSLTERPLACYAPKSGHSAPTRSSRSGTRLG